MSKDHPTAAFRLALMTTTAVLALAVAQSASAQDSQATKANDDTIVIVTAQKKSENLQRVPEAVNVVGAQELAQFHVTQLTDIGAYVPGLQIDSSGTPGQASIAIRGIGGLSQNPTASTYIDETPMGSTSPHQRQGGNMLDILPYDVQNIEVLAGPQGTLYGANAFGGVVKFDLIQPNLKYSEFRAGADTETIAGGKDLGNGVRAMINTPLINDKLGVIASYSRVSNPGYIDNAVTGQTDQNSSTQESGRFSLLFQPLDELKIRFNSLFSNIDANGNATIALDNSSDPHPLYSGYKDINVVPNIFQDRLSLFNLDVDWDLKFAKFVSATSYTHEKIVSNTDETGSLGSFVDYLYGGPQNSHSTYELALHNKKFTQEFRLSSNPGGNLDWMAGLYYDNEKGTNTQNEPVKYPDGTSVSVVDPVYVGSFPVTYTEAAAFANVDYHFTDKFDLAAGIRYAYNRQSFFTTIIPAPVLVLYDIVDLQQNVPGHSSEGVTTWNISPRYQINSDEMVYLRVATGYQAGGPNVPIFGAPASVSAARITTYETGLKSTFPSLRAQLNLAIYDNLWSKVQLTSLYGSAFATVNGGTAESRGFTLDGNIRPTSHLSFTGDVAYTDAQLTQNADLPGGPGGLKGDRLPEQPAWSGSLQANYKWTVSGDWKAHIGAGVRTVGDRYMSGTVLTTTTDRGVTFNPGDDRVDAYKLPGYTAIDLNGDLSNQGYTIRLYIKNAANTKALLTATDVTSQLDSTPVYREGTVLQPRTVGVSIDASW